LSVGNDSIVSNRASVNTRDNNNLDLGDRHLHDLIVLRRAHFGLGAVHLFVDDLGIIVVLVLDNSARLVLAHRNGSCARGRGRSGTLNAVNDCCVSFNVASFVFRLKISVKDCCANSARAS